MENKSSVPKESYPCSICECISYSLKSFKLHKEHHRKKSEHQCPLCSYSVVRKADITRHLMHHHSGTERDKLLSEKTIDESGEWYYPPSGGRRRFQFCQDCDHKDTSKSGLARHIKVVHPNSNTAIPPEVKRHGKNLKLVSSIQRTSKTTEKDSKKQSDLFRCSLCPFGCSAKRDLERHMVYHLEKSALQCSWCSYSVNKATALVRHLNRCHPEKMNQDDQEIGTDQESPAGPVANAKKGKMLKTAQTAATLKCPECEYTTYHSGNMRLHSKGHNRNEKYKCDRCSYTSEFQHAVDMHLKRYHQHPSPPSSSTEAAVGNNTIDDSNRTGKDSDNNSSESDLNDKDASDNTEEDYDGLNEYSDDSVEDSDYSGEESDVTEKSVNEPGSNDYADALSSSSKNTKSLVKGEKWYYPPGGSRRTLYNHCSSCNFKTPNRFLLMRHIKAKHPSLNQSSDNVEMEWIWLHCDDCEYKTQSKNNLRFHLVRHEKESAHKCSHCSYSVSAANALGRHMRRDHPSIKRFYDSPDDGSTSQGESEPEESAHIGEAAQEKEDEEWWIAPNGARRRYKLCKDCSFKTISSDALENHVKTAHPSSATPLPSTSGENLVKIHRFKRKEFSIKDRPKSAKLSCPHCGFTSYSNPDLKRHLIHHKEKFAHKCPYCSYTVKDYFFLARHLTHHHPEREEVHDEAEKDVDQSFLPELSEEEHDGEGVEDPGQLDRSGLTVLQNRLTNSKGRKFRAEERCTELGYTLLFCSICNFRSTTRKAFRYHQSLHRIKSYFKCPHCSYSVGDRGSLTRHVQRQHPEESSDETDESSSVEKDDVMTHGAPAALVPDEGNQLVREKRYLFECSMCDFVTNDLSQTKGHENGHKWNRKFKCHLCNYSSNFKYVITLHVNLHHQRHSKNKRSETESQLGSIQEVEIRPSTSKSSATIIKEKFGLRECSVVLVDISRNKSAMNNKSYENMEVESSPSPSQEDEMILNAIDTDLANVVQETVDLPEQDEITSNKLEAGPRDEERIQSMRKRVTAMEKKVFDVDLELKELTEKKNETRKRMDELAERKVVVEYELRTLQCEAIESNLLALDSKETDQKGAILVEERIKTLENELNGMEDLLQTLREEEKNLIEDVEVANGSHVGACQVLHALQVELLELDPNSKWIISAIYESG